MFTYRILAIVRDNATWNGRRNATRNVVGIDNAESLRKCARNSRGKTRVAISTPLHARKEELRTIFVARERSEKAVPFSPPFRAACIGVAVLALTACAAHSSAKAQDHEVTKLALSSGASTGSCGIELWSIKTLTDPNAGSVDLTPQPTTIATLDNAAAPTFSYTRARYGPIEDHVWQITATLTGYRLEADSDYHLVLTEGGSAMIAEIPDPACAAGSRVLAQVTAARAAFERDHNAANGCFSCLNETVTIQGVGFFDAPHGQVGVAPNAVELHPVLSYTPGGVTPPSPVTTTTVTTTTTPVTTTTTTADDSVDELPGCSKYPGRIYYHHRKQDHCAANFFTSP